MEQTEFNVQQQHDQYNAQAQPMLVLPDIVPGPLIVSDSAIAIWNAATQTAQDRIQSNGVALQRDPIQTTEEEKCWVTLMALRKEQELEDTIRYVENAWRELIEVRRLLGIRRN